MVCNTAGSDNDGLRHQQELKRVAQEAATAAAHKVMSQFKRQLLSVTDHAGIGKDLLEDGCTVKPQLLPVQYTTLPGVVDWEFKNDWKNTTNEDGVQVLPFHSPGATSSCGWLLGFKRIMCSTSSVVSGDFNRGCL